MPPSDNENEPINKSFLNKTNNEIETPIRYKKLHANRIIHSVEKSVKKLKLEKSQKFKTKKPIALPVYTKKNNSNNKNKVIEKILPNITPKQRRWTADETKRLKVRINFVFCFLNAFLLNLFNLIFF